MWMPDFIINGEYVEIKGVFDGKNKRKLACFQLPIRVIGKNEIGKYLHYAKSKYGPDFTSLYDKTE